ncbi:MAG: RNA polymerase subunit sigma [Actinobacteria bacterium QS_5_72_10]|nr:MAG: RNA polymerase subunit sigma [Actinobacteria bacterium QS_5_72_10]
MKHGPQKMQSARRLSAVDERTNSGDGLVTLMEAVQRGDRSAFAALYDQLSPSVYGLARRVVRDPARAEEVVQDAMVEVWRRATRFDSEQGSVRSWVLMITHRRAVDRVRTEQSRRDREERVASRDQEPPSDVVSDRVEHDFERQRVVRALDALTPLQREAVKLAYYSGLTHQEIAEALDAPLGTVKTRIRDGMIRLRDSLGAMA